MSPHEEGAPVVRVDPEERPPLLESRPDDCFVTPHYEGWPLLLVRLETVDREALAERVEDSWLIVAPKRLVAAHLRE